MNANESTRKLAAILMADVVGYSRMMGRDEEATVRRLNDCRNVFRAHIAKARGRVVNAPGDSILAEFGAVSDAVTCAVDIQRELADRNATLGDDQHMAYRIGINLGDVIVQGDEIYGDGVNIAARLESIAAPGSICISGSVHDSVAGKLDLRFESMGEQRVKNITKPVKAYRVRAQDDLGGRSIWSRLASRMPPRRKAPLVWAAVAMLAVASAAGVWWQQTRDPLLALPSGPVLAVLPFDNMSRDSEDQFFVDGVTEELITELARYKDVNVLSRNCTFPYKGRTLDVRQLQEELGADFVLDGTIRRIGDRVRVNMELIDARDGRNLWAETYERVMTPGGLVSLQDEVARQVLTALGRDQRQVHRPGLTAAVARVPDDLGSYECMLHARAFYRERFTPDQHAFARSCLEQAVARDPAYAEGWAWLAGLYAEEFAHGYNESDGAEERAVSAARKAAELAPQSPIAHAHHAYALFLSRDPAYVAQVDLALTLNPNDPELLAAMANLLALGGAWERALALVDKTLKLTPHPPARSFLLLSDRAFLDGDGEGALEFALQANLPGFYAVHVARARGYAMTGQASKALAEVESAMALYPGYAQFAARHWRRMAWNSAEADAFITAERNAGFAIP